MCLLLTSFPVCAQEAPPVRRLTVDECIAVALQNQPGIQAEEAGVGAASATQRVARSYFLPQANYTAQMTQFDQSITGDFSLPDQIQGGTRTTDISLLGSRIFTSQLSILQPIWTGGKIRVRNQEAGLGVQAAKADVAKAQQQTVYEVQRAYFGILLARELVRVADEAVGQFRAVEKLAQSLLDSGDAFVTTADVARARALRISTESQKVEVQRAVDLARAGLLTAMGLSVYTPLDVADERLLHCPVAVELEALQAQAQAQRPEVVKSEIGVRFSELEIKAAEAAFHPEIGLNGALLSLHDNREDPSANNRDLWAVGVSAKVPLFAGGRRLAERRKAVYLAQRAREAQQLVRNQVALEVQQAFLEHQEMSERVPLSASAVKDARTVLEVYENQYIGNLIAPKDMPKHFENLTNGRLLLARIELDYYKQIYNYQLALAKIQLATGAHAPALPQPNDCSPPGDAVPGAVDPRATRRP